jgi:transient receptor potential cation channel subfamily A protein 1
VIIAFLFVVAFSLAFYMILFKPVLHNQIINMSPFRTPGLSIIKTVVMTIGEFEYDDVFANTNDDNNQLTDFASLAYLLWILFLVMMPILLVNLLVALAVDDTKAIQNKAHMSKIEIQIKLMLKAERMLALLPKRIRPQLIVRDHVVRPNRRLNLWEWFKIKWGVERWDSVDNIRKYRKPDMSVVCYVKAQTKELTNQIKELKAEIAKKSETERLALETVEKLKAELARKSVKDDRVFGDLQDTISRMFRAVEELGKRLPNPTTENSR